MSCESSADPKRATSGVSSVRFACKSRQFGSQSALCSYTRRGFSVGLRSYDPGQITDQFAPLYRTGGTGGGVWDGTGFGTGSGAGSVVVVVDDGSRRGSAPPVVPSAPLGLVVSSSAKAVAADTPAVAATAANAKSASRRVRPLARRTATARAVVLGGNTCAR